jgi:hypothetical protein
MDPAAVRRAESAWVVIGAAFFAVGLVAMACLGSSILTTGALVLAAFTCLVSMLGPERVGVLILIAGFFTAPYYKGVAPSPGSPYTATDALVLLGFVLLLPRLLRGRIELPLVYWIGAGLVLFAGLISSSASTHPMESFVALTFWMIVMVGLPVGFALWAPSLVVVDLLAASFVLGHIFSFGLGWLRGNVAGGRHAGLATHPNYFAEAGMLALTLLMYLAYRHFGRSVIRSWLIVAAIALCAATVQLSGSRAAIVVVVVLIVMIPLVERSALAGLVVGATAALVLLVLPLLASLAGEGSALDRLSGGGGAKLSDSARTLGFEEGLDRFLARPIQGNGLIDLFDIHNNFLEVAVAIGIFGLAGYLLVLYSFARPLLGSGRSRRLSYGVWAYIGFGATVPSLYDRSIWTVVALSVVAMVEYERMRLSREQVATAQPLTAAADPQHVSRPGRTT